MLALAFEDTGALLADVASGDTARPGGEPTGVVFLHVAWGMGSACGGAWAIVVEDQPGFAALGGVVFAVSSAGLLRGARCHMLSV